MKLLLIDANALIHRCFHALPPLTNSQNRPAGALYGLAAIVIKILDEQSPDFIAAFFDRPEPTFRKKMYDDYKIHRPKAPDELVSQLIDAHELFESFGIKTFEIPGFEADDLIATASRTFDNTPNLKIIILTGDLDSLQLVKNDKIVVETLKKGISETIIYDEIAVKERFGVLPDQLPDYKGLVGDPSDNIPGVPGVGPKTAAPIIQKFSTLDDFFKNADVNEEKSYQKIFSFKDQAILSRDLAVFHFDAPLEIKNLSELKHEPSDKTTEKTLAYFEKTGFKSLMKRISSKPEKDQFGIIKTTNKKTPSSKQGRLLEADASAEAIQKIERPLTPILRQMEMWGIKVDCEKLKEMELGVNEEINELVKKIYRETGGEIFNINSPQQLAKILLKKFGIKLKSTNAQKLEALKEKPEIINLVLKYRELFKLKSTYIEPLAKLIKSDGRIHTTFIQLGAATGRLASENPNLQNVPESIRSAFVAKTGFKFVAFDYSQIELRILATLTEDPKMTSFFMEGKDIHTMTASQIFNVSPDNVVPQMRNVAKTLNFGVIYGMGVRKFSQESGLSQNEAKKFITEYFKDFSTIKKWHQDIITNARIDGFVENLNGRKRNLPGINSLNPKERTDSERMVINFPIQSLAADIIKLAMAKTKEKLEEMSVWGTDVKMLLSIHDELIFEIADTEELKKIAEAIEKIMESVYKLKVPLKVNVKIGDNWGEL